MARPFTCNLLDNHPRFTSKTFFLRAEKQGRRAEAIYNSTPTRCNFRFIYRLNSLQDNCFVYSETDARQEDYAGRYIICIQ